MNTNNKYHRSILQSIARQAMLERGLLPDFSTEALAELAKLQIPAVTANGTAADPLEIRDMRNLLWSSIDNDDSRDLDQLTVAEAISPDQIKILVAIADVDSFVKKGSAIDEHAQQNTTSVYTAAEIFPMLPEKLSTDLTSLNPDTDRMTVVIEMVLTEKGELTSSDVYRGLVRNHAKLAYDSVAAWLDGTGAMPDEIAAVGNLDETIRLQDHIAGKMKALRHASGALSLETIEARPVFHGDHLEALKENTKNRAKDIIEDFMIAANGVTARYLEARNFSSLRRVVRVPRNWNGIVALAAEHGATLPRQPDAKALEDFLVQAKADDALRFPDLSLGVIKLLGSGEYIVERPGEDIGGHFGLAVKDYAHSTAPNRRYPDLIAQRLLKAAIAQKSQPYTDDEL